MIRDTVTCSTALIAEAIKVKVLNFMVDGKLDCVMFGYHIVRIEWVDETRRWIDVKRKK